MDYAHKTLRRTELVCEWVTESLAVKASETGLAENVEQLQISTVQPGFAQGLFSQLSSGC